MEASQNLKYSLRSLGKDPGFLAIALIIVALGVGVNTVVFSVLDAVLLRALPYRDPNRLVWLTNFVPSLGQNLASDDIYYGWQKQNHVFEDMAAYSADEELTLTSATGPVRVRCKMVSANFVPLLGMTTALGRNFQADEDRPAGPKAVLLTDAAWRSYFNADTSVLGRVIALDGDSYTVIGVLSRDFEFPGSNSVDVLVPFQLTESSMGFTQGKPKIKLEMLEVIARLRPGVTPASAASELNEISKHVLVKFPSALLAGGQAQVFFLHDHEVGNVRPALFVLFGAVVFVLLIACANIANLQLARASSREKEVAIRGALGASRVQLARFLLIENLIVSLAGGAVGLLLATWILPLIRRFGPLDIPHLSNARLDIRVLLFTLLISALTGALVGLAPILVAFRVSFDNTLKEVSARSGAGKNTRRSQKALMVTEVALSLVLFIGAGLLMRSFVRLTAVQPGFDPHGILTARVSLPVNIYQNSNQQRTFFRQLIERIEALPGVIDVGATTALPLRGALTSSSFRIEGQPNTGMVDGKVRVVQINMVTPSFFKVLRIPLKKGRLLDERDEADASQAVVVNESFVRRFFPQQDPIQQRIETPIGPAGLQSHSWNIVGVVEDVKQKGIASEVDPEMFVTSGRWPSAEMTIILRTSGNPLNSISMVRKEVSSLDKAVPLYSIETMDDVLSADISAQRFNSGALTAFAGLAVLLAAFGVYGVMAYTVRQRTHEIGIRLALGAQQGDVVRMILTHGLRLALVGVALGLVGALILTPVMRSLLFEIKATDPGTFVAVTVGLLVVAVIACWIAARRATSVTPVTALRHD